MKTGPGHVTFVPYGDADALAVAVTDETAAVVLEPIQGEAGVRVPGEGYLAAARQVCDDHGSLLWLDEVQTGIGRTGAWFAHQLPSGQGVTPDIVTLAKGLGGGMPIGATVGIGAAGALLEPGNHGTTFGGNPVACAAALAVLDTIEKDHLLDHATALGTSLRDGLGEDARVTETRGEGLIIGIRAQHRRARRRRRGDGRRLHPQRHRAQHHPARPAARPHRGRCPDPGRLVGSDPGRERGAGMIRHLLTDDDLTPAEQAEVLALAAEMKKDPYGSVVGKPLAGPKTVALVFDRPTLRTQVSFTAGIAELGGNPMTVDGGLAAMGSRESVEDVAQSWDGRRRPSCGAPPTRPTSRPWPTTPASRWSTR